MASGPNRSSERVARGVSAISGVAVRRARIGHGLFATKAFRTGQIIAPIVGRVVHHTRVWDAGGTFADNCYRFGPNTYLDPGDGFARFVNHSCVPNAAVGKRRNRLYLFAANPIGRGREITFDYSTILGDDDIWTMRCRCGRAACRRTVRRFGALPPALRDDYIVRGMVPQFILATLDDY